MDCFAPGTAQGAQCLREGCEPPLPHWRGKEPASLQEGKQRELWETICNMAGGQGKKTGKMNILPFISGSAHPITD